MNVTIASIGDFGTRRLRENTNNRVSLFSGVVVKFTVVFDMDEQQFLDVDDGISQIIASITAAASTNQFTETLQTNALGGLLSSAVGGSSVSYTAPVTKTVDLFHPTMQPTVSSKPSVLPTIRPSTQKPTLMPTTTVPSFAPTFRTGTVCNTLHYVLQHLYMK